MYLEIREQFSLARAQMCEKKRIGRKNLDSWLSAKYGEYRIGLLLLIGVLEGYQSGYLLNNFGYEKLQPHVDRK